jgi:hypothetical protein
MTLCPICEKLYTPGAFANHARVHVRRGELVKREVTRSEVGNVTRYQWARAAVYTKPKATK